MSGLNIYTLVLGSGIGSRLYPISTPQKPKQFLKIVSDEMIILDTVKRFDSFSDKTVIVTLEKYKHFIDGKVKNIITEKKKRETAYSVLAFLEKWKEVSTSDNDIVIQTPSDHFVVESEGFKESVLESIEHAKDGKISVIGIKPVYAETDYGYIKSGHKMIEKPNNKLAERLIEDGYVWNTAIYVYKPSKVLDYYSRFFRGEETSFEKAILEEVDNLQVVEGSFIWHDLGTHERLSVVQNL